MAPVNFAGKLPVAVVLTWKGEVLANAPTQVGKNFQYVLANDLLSSFTILFAGAGPGQITRKATSANKQFDAKLNTYISDPLPGEHVDEIIALGKNLPHSIDMTVTFHPFFDVLLEQMTRTDADLHTFANPNDSAAILSTFTHRRSNVDINVDYKLKSETFKDIQCNLVDHSVTPRPGKAPEVKLVFELDFTPFDDIGRSIMRKLIAMDWGRLAKFGQVVAKGKTMANNVAVWFGNRNMYVLNHSDLVRANRIRTGIFNRHNGKTAAVLATDLRNDIDLHLIASNHWGQDREDLKTERHQFLLSDLFGTLHQKAWLASPVMCLRTIDDIMESIKKPLTRDDYAALALQYGVGHCGEHSEVSYSILTDMIFSPGDQMITAVKTGNANVDHAYVVYNIQVHDGILTIPVNAQNPVTKDRTDKRLRVFNLKQTINANKGRDGFVMDPYLDKKDKILTAAALLDNLTGKERTRQGIKTEFLAFNDELREPADLLVDDITADSAASRSKAVPNV